MSLSSSIVLGKVYKLCFGPSEKATGEGQAGRAGGSEGDPWPLKRNRRTEPVAAFERHISLYETPDWRKIH